MKLIKDQSSIQLNEYIDGLLSIRKQRLKEKTNQKIKEEEEYQEKIAAQKKVREIYSELVLQANENGKSIKQILVEKGISLEKAKIVSKEAKRFGFIAEADKKRRSNFKNKFRVYVNGYFISRIIAIILLLVAIGDLPYGFYTLLRFIVCGVAAYGALISNELEKDIWTWIFGIIAILFNPLIPIHLDKGIWTIIDIIVAAILLSSLFLIRKPSHDNNLNKFPGDITSVDNDTLLGEEERRKEYSNRSEQEKKQRFRDQMDKEEKVKEILDRGKKLKDQHKTKK